MFDVGFNRFLSLTALSVAWVVTLVLAGTYFLASLAVGIYIFTNGLPGWGALLVIGGLVGALVFVLLVRLRLETIAVLFRIAESARDIAEQSRASRMTVSRSYAYTPENYVQYGPRRR